MLFRSPQTAVCATSLTSSLPSYMPSRPIEAHHKNAARSHLSHAHLRTLGQHGKTRSLSHGASILLRFPSESLTHITSFLDPDALLALSATNKQLHAHVKDDNTWRRAYVYQFLGISPESDLRDNDERKSLMLRREESTWRREFVLRHNLRRCVRCILNTHVADNLPGVGNDRATSQ